MIPRILKSQAVRRLFSSCETTSLLTGKGDPLPLKSQRFPTERIEICHSYIFKRIRFNIQYEVPIDCSRSEYLPYLSNAVTFRNPNKLLDHPCQCCSSKVNLARQNYHRLLV